MFSHETYCRQKYVTLYISRFDGIIYETKINHDRMKSICLDICLEKLMFQLKKIDAFVPLVFFIDVKLMYIASVSFFLPKVVIN